MGSPARRCTALALSILIAASLTAAQGSAAAARPVVNSPEAVTTSGSEPPPSDGDLARQTSDNSRGAVTARTISAAPSVEIHDGIIRGNLNITGAGNEPLRFKVLPSAKGGKLTMGTVPSDDPSTTAQSFTILPYADWLGSNLPRGEESFVVRVSSASTASPSATKAIDVTITVDIGELAPDQAPLAFTYRVDGYARTGISVNFFPASGLGEGNTAPLILQGSALGAPGNTNPYQAFDTKSHSPGTASFRAEDGSSVFNVITWDPRGSYASEGTYQLNDPFLDGIDVKRIVSWAAGNTPTTLNGAGDPAVGMIGGSSGGEIQLVVAGIDPRIDAIAPATTWNSLINTLQPNGVLDTTIASRLLSALSKPQIRLSPQLRTALRGGIASGRLTDSALTLLANKNAGTLLSHLQAPTLLWQSTSDPLFSVNQSMDTAQEILSNPFGTPVKMAWFDGAARSASTIEAMTNQTVAWMAKYVVGLPIPDSFTPEFQWWDQNGDLHASALYPFSPGFNGPDPITATSRGGRLTVAADCTKTTRGIAITAAVPDGAQIAGVPSLQLNYRVTGGAQAICVRITDASTGRALSSPVTLLPVIPDGRPYTAAYPLGALAFTGQPGSQIRVTIWGAAQPGEKPASVSMSVSGIDIALPRHAPN